MQMTDTWSIEEKIKLPRKTVIITTNSPFQDAGYLSRGRASGFTSGSRSRWTSPTPASAGRGPASAKSPRTCSSSGRGKSNALPPSLQYIYSALHIHASTQFRSPARDVRVNNNPDLTYYSAAGPLCVARARYLPLMRGRGRSSLLIPSCLPSFPCTALHPSCDAGFDLLTCAQ